MPAIPSLHPINYLSIYKRARLPLLSIYLSIYLPIHLCINLRGYCHMSMPAFPPLLPINYLSIYLFIYLPIYLSNNLRGYRHGHARIPSATSDKLRHPQFCFSFLKKCLFVCLYLKISQAVSSGWDRQQPARWLFLHCTSRICWALPGRFYRAGEIKR